MGFASTIPCMTMEYLIHENKIVEFLGRRENDSYVSWWLEQSIEYRNVPKQEIRSPVKDNNFFVDLWANSDLLFQEFR